MNLDELDELYEYYEYYDSQLSSTLDKADSMISQIEVTTEITWTDYLAYASCGLSAFNFIIFCVAFRCFHSLVRRRLADKSTALFLESPPLEAQNLLSLNHPTPAEFASVATSRSNKVIRIPN